MCSNYFCNMLCFSMPYSTNIVITISKVPIPIICFLYECSSFRMKLRVLYIGYIKLTQLYGDATKKVLFHIYQRVLVLNFTLVNNQVIFDINNISILSINRFSIKRKRLRIKNKKMGKIIIIFEAKKIIKPEL